jgi:hypothetical protein
VNAPSRYEPAAGGATFHVAPNGDDAGPGTEAAPFRTIRRALAAAGAAGPGQRVRVRTGIYVEGDPGEDEHALRIATDDTAVYAAPGEVVEVRPAPGVTYGVAIAASRATWSGIAVSGFLSAGIDVHDGRAIETLEDVVVADTVVTMATAGPGGEAVNDGIAVYPDQRASGVPVVRGLLLERVLVADASLGVNVGAGPVQDLALQNVVVLGRSAGTGSSGADAIAVEEGDNVLLNGVSVRGAEADGVDTKASRVSILNADVRSGRNGIKLWRGGEIVNTLVHDTGADAALVFGRGEPPAPGAPADAYRVVNSVVAFHNRPDGGTAYAMTVGYDVPEWPQTLEIVNTVFYRNSSRWSVSVGTRVTLRSCVFFGSGDGQVVEHGWGGPGTATILETDPTSSLAAFADATGVLPFLVDPRLLDPAADERAEFRPGTASPLIDAGAVVPPMPSVDLDGSPRVVGAAPDIGPFEGGR